MFITDTFMLDDECNQPYTKLQKKKVIYIDLYSVVLSCTYLTSVIRAVDYANMYK